MGLTQSDVIEKLLAFIAADGASIEQFNALALELFAYQFEHNVPYRRFCRQRSVTPRTVHDWCAIPAVPISAFKALTLSCSPPESAEAVFMTSGTTQGIRGKSYHPTLEVWRTSMRRNFAARVMAGRGTVRMGIAFPDEGVMTNSSLATYLGLAMREFGAEGSHYLVGEEGIDLARLLSELERAERTGEPYALLGASYSVVHILDALAAQGRTARLPAGSFVMDTGGFKGQSRELELDAFYDQIAATLGVAREQCINMYGMTELSSQFYDAGNAVCPSVKSGPHWVRTRAVNPLTGEQVPRGEQGVLAHCDLAHFNIVTTILTEDAGVEVDDGFLLLGRADGAEAKGCSMAVEEFLRAAGS